MYFKGFSRTLEFKNFSRQQNLHKDSISSVVTLWRATIHKGRMFVFCNRITAPIPPNTHTLLSPILGSTSHVELCGRMGREFSGVVSMKGPV